MLNTAPKSLPPQSSKQPLIIKKRHAQILTAVRSLRFVTVADIQKLLFTYPTTSKHVGKILSDLSGGDDYLPRHYLFRFPLPDTKPGNPTRIYTLGSLGLTFMRRELGMAINWSFHPDKLQHMNYYPLQHALTLTRFLVEIQAYCRKQKEIRVTRMVTQYDLPGLFRETTKKDANRHLTCSPVPDAFLDLEYLKEDGSHSRFVPVLVEIDRATEYRTSFQARLASRLAFIKPEGLCRELFGIKAAKMPMSLPAAASA